MIHSNPPARQHRVAALLLTSALALVFTGITNAATDTPEPPATTGTRQAPADTGAPAPRPPAAPAAEPAIKADLAALKALANQEFPKEFDKMTDDQQMQFFDQRACAITEKALAIYDTYKDDPRRWEAIPYLFEVYPNFYKPVTLPDAGADETGSSPLEKDTDKAKAHQARLDEIKTAMAASTDVPAKVRETMATQALSEKLMSANMNAFFKAPPPPDLTALRTEVDACLAAWPKSGSGGRDIVRDYIRLEARLLGTPKDEILKTFAQSPHAAVKKYVQDRLAFLDTVSKPLDITRTAADGRKIDLAELRGKVVLIDFWATWCGPCIKALPDMKALYAKYHDKGLEIVGIALEDARYTKKDKPDQMEKKRDAAKKKLLDFVEKEQIPWPQYCGFRGWNTDVAAKYNIKSVPTIFILNKDGALAVEDSSFTNFEREDLESEIIRLLGLGIADVPAETRQALATRALSQKIESAGMAVYMKQTPPPDITALRAEVDAYLAEWPGSDDALEIVSDYIKIEAQIRGVSQDEIIKTFAQSPNTAVKEYAQKRLAFLTAVSKPLDMAFTAADGREVDLAKLRGKVVLIDFWATWCGPCVRELPNMKALYSNYHDKGLEVIGIALEDARLAPKTDTPEQTEKKLAAAKKALLGFVGKQQMPWPQYLDGKGWKTDYAVKYNINSVPTMFILNKDGMLAVECSPFTDVKREDLEKEVKRLLGL